MNRAELPNDFLFGAATAAYQVEGASSLDGRSSCIWDDFALQKGAIKDMSDGRFAADQYHHYEEDIQLMYDLGFDAYRFSVSWSRVLPNGKREVNKKGIEYYKKLCTTLHNKGMKAACTIYHWDLPSEIQEYGGWANRQVVDDFAFYAKTLFIELKDYVDMWITINEPFCIAYLGYRVGVHAPGHQNIDECIKAIHHVNLAHGKAVKAYRELGLDKPIGIVINPQTPRAATRREEDKIAALNKRSVDTEVFTGPIFGHGYPSYCTNKLKWSFPIEEGDMELISQKIDFLGVNYYNEYPVVYDEASLDSARVVPTWERHTDIGWPVDEKGLLRQLLWLKEHTNDIDIYITENGSAEDDHLTSDGRVHDEKRIIYIDKHLHAVSEAIKANVKVKGYFIWSLIDNFEWAEGYTKRFGIVYCDYATQKRYPKDSAYYLRDVIAGFGDF